ncbi:MULTISPECIES: MFS transporter [unclassified Acidisoma]|jgi:MFS transporter, ACS family, tartrate transporter|uniref:MFS transporter n=1 Tax=unclassified Acidisoma TaxID=2634065 RepID=UPI00131AF2CF|nr:MULTISPECIES: MFS transporter [unclassified Acidisoma]
MDIETRTIRRVTRRLIPFLMLCYFVAYLDRVNVGFAALGMNKELGFTATVFGFGAGIFFIAYFFFEVPSNLALEKFGARKWIARIMFSWGVVAGAMAFVPQISALLGVRASTTFIVLRVLLGLAEAGFFPGIIFFLTIWFPARYRGRMIGYFMAAIPLSTVVGGPISGALLNITGLGLSGWQWMFLIEALPAILLSVVVLFYLTDRAADATWLAPDERAWLVERLASERAKRERAKRFGILEAISNTRVLLLAFVYFGINGTNYGLSFFLPQIVRGFGLSYTATGFVTALPYVAGTIGMIYWGRHSDRAGERREHVAIAALIAGLGIAGSTLVDDPVGKMLLLTLAGFGIFGVLPVFWTLPTNFLAGAAAASGIAAVNSLGNLSGFFGPYVMGKIKDSTGSYTIGLLAIACVVGFAMLVALSLSHDQQLENLEPDEVLPPEL